MTFGKPHHCNADWVRAMRRPRGQIADLWNPLDALQMNLEIRLVRLMEPEKDDQMEKPSIPSNALVQRLEPDRSTPDAADRTEY